MALSKNAVNLLFLVRATRYDFCVADSWGKPLSPRSDGLRCGTPAAEVDACSNGSGISRRAVCCRWWKRRRGVVATVDPGATRNTKDVDILLRREDLPAARRALEDAGFVYRQTAGIDMFLDGPDAGPRDAIHIVPAREKIKPEYHEPSPDVQDASRPADFDVVTAAAIHSRVSTGSAVPTASRFECCMTTILTIPIHIRCKSRTSHPYYTSRHYNTRTSFPRKHCPAISDPGLKARQMDRRDCFA